MRSSEVVELIEASAQAFTLATVIALRARFQPGKSLMGLAQGECFVGDHHKYGMTRQQYRTAMRQLTEWNFATFKPTSKGTVARLTDTRLFDVLNEVTNQQDNHQPTNGQPSSNQRPTTNKEGKKDKNVELTNCASRRSAPSRGSLIELAVGKGDSIEDAEKRVKRFYKVNTKAGYYHPDSETWQAGFNVAGAFVKFREFCEFTGPGKCTNGEP